MDYRILGKTGLKISRMGLGGIPIQRIDAEGTKKIMHQLMDAGVNFVDSARGYSVSEEYLGYALEGIRDKFVIATKSMARSKEAMAKDVDISLKNLRTDYIDLYQIHNPSLEQLAQVIGEGGALEALMEAKAAGKIGHIGVTVHSAKVFEQVLEMDWVESIMFPYNIVETHGEELFAAAKAKNIGIIDMKPLAGGALDNAALAVRFVAANPNVDVIIPGMADAAEVEMNLAAVNCADPFTAEELAEMERIRQEMGTSSAVAATTVLPAAWESVSLTCSSSTAIWLAMALLTGPRSAILLRAPKPLTASAAVCVRAAVPITCPSARC